MARISLFLLLLGCTLLQRTLAEFGSLGTIQSSQTIKTSTDGTTVLFDAVNDLNGLVLETDYGLFSEVLPLMESLGEHVTTLGMTLTTTISNAVPNNSGNLNAVFDPIQSHVTALIAFIDGEQATTRTTLTNLLGTDIDHLFGDVFGNMRLALLRVRTAFIDFKQSLQTATVLNGRTRLPAGIVGAVLLSINLLRSTVLPVQYTVHTTIENIQMGDLFLADLELITTDLISSLQQYFTDFRTDLLGLGVAVRDERNGLEGDWTGTRDGVGAVTTNLASLAEYSAFGGALDTLDSAYDTLLTLEDDVKATFETYLDTASSYLDQFQEVLVPRDYLSITVLLEVLVAGGPHARFCYFKFSPRLVNYYSNLASDVEGCFSIEIARLDWLYDIAQALFQLILYDVEDLLGNLTVCNDSTTPAECIDAIGPYYAALFSKTQYKVGYFAQLAQAEANASINRLGACMYSWKIFNMQKLFTVTTDIEACRTAGPEAPDLGE